MKADRMNRKNLTRKPDPLMLLVAAVVLGAVMSTTVRAAEPFQFKPQDRLAGLVSMFGEEGYRVTRLGNTDAGLHVSMTPPAGVKGGSKHGLKNMYLSIRLPW